MGRVIYALGEVQETNRHWTVGRPSYYQFDPYSETLIGLDAQTNERIPRLAKSWEATPDGRTWTFQLEEGIPFHFGHGEFTSADVVASFDRILGEDSQGFGSIILQGRDLRSVRRLHRTGSFPVDFIGYPFDRFPWFRRRRDHDAEQEPVRYRRAGRIRCLARRHRFLPVRREGIGAKHLVRKGSPDPLAR